MRANQVVYALSIGSGYRAHPLDDNVDDQLYIMFDTNSVTGEPATTPGSLDLGDLYDATANLIQTAGTQAARNAELTQLGTKAGWYLNLGSNEKVLARVRIFRNRVFASTFTPEGSTVCELEDTTNRLYGVRLFDGTGAIPQDTNNDGVIDYFARNEVVVDQAAILDEPLIITYHTPGDPGGAGVPPKPPSSCSGIFGGTQQLLALCTAPIKVNWANLQ